MKTSALPFEDFAKQISADVWNALGLGSIASKLSSDYSQASHAHSEYAGMELKSYCSNRRDDVLCSLVTFELDGFSENVSIPGGVGKPYISGISSTQLAPRIGEMRLFAVSSLKRLQEANDLVLDMSSDEFSGWIQPNGQIIDPKRFPGAAEVFGARLPVIDGHFMKLKPLAANAAEGEDSSQLLPPSSPMPLEQH